MQPPERYVPEAGDVVWIDLGEQSGHEQAGHRPALVLSPRSYNSRSGLALCCPITRQRKGYPFELPLPDDCPVTGVILVDQVKCIDWTARRARLAARVDGELMVRVTRRLRRLLPDDSQSVQG